MHIRSKHFCSHFFFTKQIKNNKKPIKSVCQRIGSLHLESTAWHRHGKKMNDSSSYLSVGSQKSQLSLCPAVVCVDSHASQRRFIVQKCLKFCKVYTASSKTNTNWLIKQMKVVCSFYIKHKVSVKSNLFFSEVNTDHVLDSAVRLFKNVI